MVEQQDTTTSTSQEMVVFEIKGQMKKLDTAEDVLNAIEEGKSEDEKFNKICEAAKIKLCGNSFGLEACKYVAEQIACRDTPNLVDIDFSDIFVSRLRAELPQSLEALSQAILPKQQIRVLDVSHNAFGPDGVRAFECLLE